MKLYKIISPNNISFTVFAESIYHAVEKVRSQENYKFTNAQYLKLNGKYKF
jgi:hypothetical protein